MRKKTELTSSSSSDFTNKEDYKIKVVPVDSTSGVNVWTWYHSSPAKIDVGRKASEVISDIRNETVKNAIILVLAAIEKVIKELFTESLDLEVIPPLEANLKDDESVLLEWVAKDFRVGFSIEPDIDESGWYLVSSPELGDMGASGFLFREGFEDTIKQLVAFVIANT